MKNINPLKFILSSKPENIILATIVLFALVINLIWLQKDNRVVETRDETVYLSRTLAFIDNFGFKDIEQGIKELSLAGRPPLFLLLSIPLILGFGKSLDAGTYINLFFLVILIISTFKIGKYAKDGRVGLLAAVLMSAYPPAIRLLRIYRTNFATIACVALTVWFLFMMLRTRSIRAAWLTNLSLAFGLLIHPTYLWGIPIPVALVLVYDFLFGEEPRLPKSLQDLPQWFLVKLRQPLFLRGVLPSAVIAVGLVLSWYIPFGSALLDVAEGVWTDLEASGTRLFLGDPYYPASLWYFVTSGNAISVLLAAMLWVGTIAALWKREHYGFLLVFMFLFAYGYHSTFLTMSWRYFAQILPVAAVLTALWVIEIRNKVFSTALILICVAASLFNVLVVSFGVNRVTEPLAVAFGALEGYHCQRISFAFYCPDPPQLTEWPIRELVGVAANDPECNNSGCDLSVSTGSFIVYQAVYFSTSVDFRDVPLTLHYLAYRPTSEPSDALYFYYDFLSLLESEYLFVNLAESQLGLPEYDFLQAPSELFMDSHQIVAKYNVPDGSEAVLYKRIKPLTLSEAEEVISAVDVPGERKLKKFFVFIHLAEQAGENEKVLSLYEEALEQVEDPGLRGEYLVGLANKFLELENFIEAKKHYLQVLDLEPENYTAHSALLNIYQQEGNCVMSIPHAVKLTEIKPRTGLYVTLGTLYLDCNDPALAALAYQDALSLDETSMPAHLGLAQSYDLQGKIEEARIEFEWIVENSQNSKYIVQAQIWLDSHK